MTNHPRFTASHDSAARSASSRTATGSREREPFSYQAGPPMCTAFDTHTHYWGKGIVDPSEYDDPRGVKMTEVRGCKFAVEPGQVLCAKHLFLANFHQSKKADAVTSGVE